MPLNYIIKTASIEDIETYYNNRINKEPDNEYLPIQKEKRLCSATEKTAMFFYGYLGNEMICQASAVISKDDPYMQNKEFVLKDKSAYLFNFLTDETHRGKGYFSKLYKYMEKTLSNMGFEYLSLGVEPDDIENKERYNRYGFTKLIYEGVEKFDGMEIDVLYFQKKIVL